MQMPDARLKALSAAFVPEHELAVQILPLVIVSDDGSHDAGHLIRVWKNVLRIRRGEGGNVRVLAAATLLHDCVAAEKNAPNRADASRLAAERAYEILDQLGWRSSDMMAVAHAVLAHSFSAGIPPETLEAKILQDADRLDALGMIGAARCFYIAGRFASGLYDPLDPMARARPLDDKAFALDHFETKLLKLADGFQTGTGRMLARERHERLGLIRELLLDEI